MKVSSTMIFTYCYKYENRIYKQPANLLREGKRNKKKLFCQYYAKEDYLSAVFLFSNFGSVAREKFVWLCYKSKLISKDEFSKLLTKVYVSANIASGFRLFLSNKQIIDMFKYSNQKFLMNKIEFKKFNNLQDEITIYRSRSSKIKGDNNIYNGISWTLKKEVALFFAKYHAERHGVEQKYLIKGIIKKQFIYAFFNERNEYEIICDPMKVKVESTIEYF